MIRTGTSVKMLVLNALRVAERRTTTDATEALSEDSQTEFRQQAREFKVLADRIGATARQSTEIEILDAREESVLVSALRVAGAELTKSAMAEMPRLAPEAEEKLKELFATQAKESVELAELVASNGAAATFAKTITGA